MASRQRDQPCPVRVQEHTGTYHQRTGSSLHKDWKGGLDVAFAANIEIKDLLSQGVRCGVHVTSLRLGFTTVRIHEHGDCCRLGHEFPKQLQSLCPQHSGKKANACDVAARMVQVGDQTLLDWVTPSPKHDRHRGGRCFRGQRRNAVANYHGYWL